MSFPEGGNENKDDWLKALGDWPMFAGVNDTQRQTKGGDTGLLTFGFPPLVCDGDTPNPSGVAQAGAVARVAGGDGGRVATSGSTVQSTAGSTRKRKRFQAEISSDERGGELEDEDEDEEEILDEEKRQQLELEQAQERSCDASVTKRSTGSHQQLDQVPVGTRNDSSPRNDEPGGRAARSSRGRVRKPHPWRSEFTGRA
jgi:hypothetical protein